MLYMKKKVGARCDRLKLIVLHTYNVLSPKIDVGGHVVITTTLYNMHCIRVVVARVYNINILLCIVLSLYYCNYFVYNEFLSGAKQIETHS